MAMRLYTSDLPDGGTCFTVWLDDKRGEQGDPDWTAAWSFPAVDPADPPMTGSSDTFDPKCDLCGVVRSQHDDADHKFETTEEPPMRAMTAREVQAQREGEVVALAKEELARRVAAADQAEADPFVGKGKVIG